MACARRSRRRVPGRASSHRRATYRRPSTRQDAASATPGSLTFRGCGARHRAAWLGGLPAPGGSLLAPRRLRRAGPAPRPGHPRARCRRAAAIEFYERGLARIEDRWAGTGEPGERFRDDRHLYANDLDLFGRGSLFELLSHRADARRRRDAGDWLTHPAVAGEMRARQRRGRGADARARPARGALAGRRRRARGRRQRSPRRVGRGGAAACRVMAARRWRCVLTASRSARPSYWAVTGDPAPFIAVVVARSRCSPFRSARACSRRCTPPRAGPRPRRPRARARPARARRLQGRAPARATSPSPATRDGRARVAPPSPLHRLVELHDWQHNQFFAPIAARAALGHASRLGDRGLAPRARRPRRAPGCGPSANSRRSARCPRTATSTRTIRGRRSSTRRRARTSTASTSGIRCFRRRAWSATTCA